MKAIKVLPSAVSSASYYLRYIIQSSLQKLLKEKNLPASRVTISWETNPSSTRSPRVESALEKHVEEEKSTPKTGSPPSVEGQECLFETAMNGWMSSSPREGPPSGSGSSAEPHPGSSNSPTPGSSETKGKTISSPGIVRLTRSGIETRTRKLVKSLAHSSNSVSQTIRLQELCRHLLIYPDATGLSVKEGAIPVLLRLREWSKDRIVEAHARQGLALLGYADPPKSTGIRILSIDGGGTRGVVIVEMLRHLEKLVGKPVHQMFDLICGVSTGAIITMLAGALQTNPSQCDELYKKVSRSLFNESSIWRGTGRLLMTHAYYETSAWEKILKQVFTERSLIESSQNKEVPKVMAISSLMNTERLQPFVFRNFNLPDRANSYYKGSCEYKIWEAVRASAAAPGYFEECALDNYIHQDGGILINNPSAIAIHEAQLLWPNETIQCCISVGTGRFTPNIPITGKPIPAAPTSLKAKINSFIDSATDTEVVHRLLQDLLPVGTYFRLNPTLKEYASLDETRPEKLDQMKTDAQMYLRKNEYKVQMASQAISHQRGYIQNTRDKVRLNYLLRK